LLLQAPSALAITDGQDIFVPKTPEQELIRRVTVTIYTGQFGHPGYRSCTGASIGNGDILSVGHCAQEFSEELKKGHVFIEAYDPTAPNRKKVLQVTSADSKYDGRPGHKPSVDLAVFHIAGNFPYQASVPLAYSKCDQLSSPIVAGYGLNQHSKAPGYLKQTTYAREPDHRSALAKWSGDKMLNFKANADGRVCYGDSGAPVFCKVHGHLAIAGVFSGFDRETASYAATKTSYDCLVADKMSATSVADSMNQIEAWRNSSNTVVPEEYSYNQAMTIGP
jgi:hypothetical protein